MALPRLLVCVIAAASLLPALHAASKKNTSSAEDCPTKITECKDGIMIPTWVTPVNAGGTAVTAARAFVYLITMFFLFLGISIISDRFMTSIEVITSQEKDITIKDKATGKKQVVTVKIWNETVANLTLMALGSSAPEIMLSVIEIIGRNFVAGELGPSTIVGSAAFNLFMITAVCVSVLPTGEVRRIKHLNVFAFTATCSISAYIWMYLILAVISPGIIEVWEGIITLLCFPGMVGAAWLIDRRINFYRLLRKKIRKKKKHGHTVVQTGDGDIVQVHVKNGGNLDLEKNGIDSFDDRDMELLAYKEGEDPENHMNEKKRIAMEAFHRTKVKYPDADAATLKRLVEQQNLKLQHKSRAFYRIQATRSLTGQGSVYKLRDKHQHKEDADQALQVEMDEMNTTVKLAGIDGNCVYFHPADYTCVESCGNVYLNVVRVGEEMFDTIYVDYETVEGTATEKEDFVPTRGVLEFQPGEKSKKIPITIIDDDIFELDEYFYCKLTGVRCAADKVHQTMVPTLLAQPDTATITILDDDYPGVFTLDHAEFEVMETVGVLTLRVVRLIGARGVIRVPYHTVEATACGGGEDFEDCVGEVEFSDDQTIKTIDIQIIDREEYEKKKSFSVVLGMPKIVKIEQSHISNLDSVKNEELKRILEAGKPSLGEHKSCEVRIVECKEFKKTIDSMLGGGNTNVLASNSWADQFREAFEVEFGGDDEEDEDAEPAYSDYIMHYLSLFWKILFAFIPPTDIWGGWACFWASISMVGLLTAVTGDIASHFGCTVGLADSVVAISFVALGTSLPDTFASKVAACNDETADSSIGNVTGSNSVNVFLGIGLAWSVAAIYHEANGNYFHVEPGALGFSVLIFCVEALICISIMMFRRFNPNIQAELGGPKSWRIATSCICASLWLMYLLLSSLQTYCHIKVDF